MLSLQNLDTLSEHSYFYGNVATYISSMRMCPSYNRTQLEALVMLPQDAVGNIDYSIKALTRMSFLR